VRDLILPVEEQPGELSFVRGGCLHCQADLSWSGTPFVSENRPLRCPRCGTEHLVDLSANGTRVKVRLPRNCDAWFEVESSNVAAVGARGPDLIVRFRSGGSSSEYLYVGGGDLLPEFLRAESKGRFFQERVRSLLTVNLSLEKKETRP